MVALQSRARPVRLSIAPMMDRTDRHFRYILRQVTRHTLLYTEMITTGAILHGDQERHLGYHADEHPVALQLGGDDPAHLARCAALAEAYGYDELNLNVGCPSDRVQNGNFGACLMARPERVAECVAAMRAATRLPVTVKHRIGIDGLERYEDMLRFVDVVREAGCDRFSVHARIAILGGLSPAENRTVPPLRYAEVYRLKAERPELLVELNGGVRTLAEAEGHLAHVDAVMMGRAAYETPWIFAEADARIFGDLRPVPSRIELIRGLYPYIEAQLTRGARLGHVTRHLLTFFPQVRGSRAFKRHLAERAHQPSAGLEDLETALRFLEDERADAAAA